MKIIESGHIYRLDHIDGDGNHDLIFVNREAGLEHEGTQCQEVIRALIDRVVYLDKQLPWDDNAEILKNLRMALVLFEARALIRKVEKGLLNPESLQVDDDGHFAFVESC